MEEAGGFWLGFGILILIWILSLVFDTIMIRILAFYLDLKVQSTSMSSKSSFGALEDAGDSWLGFGILILILIWSLVFYITMIQILAFYLDFEGTKNTHVLYFLIWGFRGCWRFPIWVWLLDLDLNMVTGFWHTHDPNFGSLSWFWRCKEHPCPLSPHLGLWRTLDVPD